MTSRERADAIEALLCTADMWISCAIDGYEMPAFRSGTIACHALMQTTVDDEPLEIDALEAAARLRDGWNPAGIE